MDLDGFLLLCNESVVDLLRKHEESEGSRRKATATILSTVATRTVVAIKNRQRKKPLQNLLAQS